MIKKMSERMVNWQIRKHLLKQEDYALYQYSYEVFINQLVNILIAIMIAIVLKAPLVVFCFLTCYIPLRSFCGGYHARTNEGCILVSTLLVAGVCLLVKIIGETGGAILPPFSFIVSGIFVFKFAPVLDQNKPLDADEICCYRTKSRVVWLLEATIGVVFYFIYAEISWTIALGHLIMVAMICLGLFNNYKLGLKSNI